MSITASRPNSLETGAAVSIVVVNYNGGGHLIRCLEGLARQSYPAFEVLAFDCASTDGSFEAAAACHDHDIRFRFQALGYNAGFAKANNIGAREAKGQWLLTLNPDAIPAPGWLQALLDGGVRHPDVGLFGCTQWRARDYETFGPCAAALMVDREGVLELGGFDESFFCYFDDVDFAFRWRLAGGRAMLIPVAEVAHVGGSGAAAGVGSAPVVRASHRRPILTVSAGSPTRATAAKRSHSRTAISARLQAG